MGSSAGTGTTGFNVASAVFGEDPVCFAYFDFSVPLLNGSGSTAEVFEPERAARSQPSFAARAGPFSLGKMDSNSAGIATLLTSATGISADASFTNAETISFSSLETGASSTIG